MRRIIMLVVVALVMAAMMLAMPMPAFAVPEFGAPGKQDIPPAPKRSLTPRLSSLPGHLPGKGTAACPPREVSSSNVEH